MRCAAVIVILSFASGAGAATEAALTLLYQDRPPYSERLPSGEVQGLVATPAAAAVAAAGIPVQWAQAPAQRQLALIQGGTGRVCGLGWFRTPEREARGRFSRALYRDLPFAAVVRAELPIASGVRSAELVADARYPVLVKEGYSYGPQLDAILARAATPVLTSAETRSMPDMLRAKRAAWMPAAGEEAGLLVGPGLRRIAFSDLPPGQTRHLYCSPAVPEAWIERIDRALAPLR